MEASNYFVLEKGIKVTKYAYKLQELPNYAIKELIVKNTFFQKNSFVFVWKAERRGQSRAPPYQV